MVLNIKVKYDLTHFKKFYNLNLEMKLTQELLIKFKKQCFTLILKGEINWKDGDDIEVQIAGTFAKDKFIVIKNISKNPCSCAPHPHFDYEKKYLLKMVERKKNLKVMSEFIQRHIGPSKNEQAEMLTDFGTYKCR